MATTRKIVINSRTGVFHLPPEALRLLHGRGCVEIASPVEVHFDLMRREGDAVAEAHARESLERALKYWHEYLRGEQPHSIMLDVFSEDEKYVLPCECSCLKRDDARLIEVALGQY